MPLIIINSSLAGLASGAASFTATWIAYYIFFYFIKWPVFDFFKLVSHLLKWLTLGFRDDKPANEQKE